MDRLKTMLIGLAIFGGVKYCNAADTRADLESHLIEICESNRNCEGVVDSHFDTCFDLATAGQRRDSKVNAEKLVGCLNRKAGFEYLGLDPRGLSHH